MSDCGYGSTHKALCRWVETGEHDDDCSWAREYQGTDPVSVDDSTLTESRQDGGA